MKKILLVFGTRPEAIKMAPLVKEFQLYPEYFEVSVCVTAQHREMLDQVLDLFEIYPDYDLNIMKPNQSLHDISSKILYGVKGVLDKASPDLVLVHGDTTTSTFTALAAFYDKIKVGHIEAGLRTRNIYSPFPEEVNRRITGVLAHYHFAPTTLSKSNLEEENHKNILITGNTVIDSLFFILKKIKNNEQFRSKIVHHFLSEKFKFVDERRIVLVTGHRRENHGRGFIDVCNALEEIAILNPSIDIVYPVHMNPNVEGVVRKLLSKVSNIFLIKPLRYEQFVYLMHKSYIIITDSGGVQEEAPSMGKPVLVMRDTTERPEALKAGTVKLVGTNTKKIVDETNALINDAELYESMSNAYNPYGDGEACKKIVDFFIRSDNEY
jgi:UDP-N-acetylglucosamine 2-epimerase (non-hydrolysing)